jgi:hypothetical protein
VIVPDGEPVEAVITATSVTLWLVTGDDGVAMSEVVLGPAACVSVVCADRCRVTSVAVIVA